MKRNVGGDTTEVLTSTSPISGQDKKKTHEPQQVAHSTEGTTASPRHVGYDRALRMCGAAGRG